MSNKQWMRLSIKKLLQRPLSSRHRRAEVMNQPLLPCLPKSEFLYVLNWDFSTEITIDKKNASGCLCVCTIPKSDKVSFLTALPWTPAPWFGFPCPCPKAPSPLHQCILLDWPKRVCDGVTMTRYYVLSSGFAFPALAPRFLLLSINASCLTDQKECATGLPWPTIKSCFPRGSLQRQFQCCCSQTCL